MKFSVAMCTYNGAQYLPEQLESIAAQTRLPDLLVICDDHSSDDTRKIIESFAAKSPFPVSLYVNRENIGTAKNFERAIGLCGGDLIALSDQDDVWHPEKLRRLEEAFISAPHVGLIFTDAEIVDGSLRSIDSRLWELMLFSQKEQRLIERGKALELLLRQNIVTGATMAFRASFVKLISPIPPDALLVHDIWIAWVVASIADIAFISEPLIKYRQHPKQQTGFLRTRDSSNSEHKRAHASIISEYYLSEQHATKSEIKYALASFHLFELNRLYPYYQRLLALCREYNQQEGIQTIETRIAYLQGKAAHYHARAKMTEGRLGRLNLVLKELLTLRYHHYSQGIFSAARDFLNL